MDSGSGPDLHQTSSDHDVGRFFNSAEPPCLICLVEIILALQSHCEAGISVVGGSNTLCRAPPNDRSSY